MRTLNPLVALCVAILLSAGCDVPVPLGTSEIQSISVSETGEVAVVATRPAGEPRVWTRTEFQEGRGSWRLVAHGAGKLLYQGSELLQLRLGDLYRVRDGVRRTSFGDIADAAATSDELIVARPWGDAGVHVFFRIRDGRARHLLTSWYFVPGTLAVYDFGQGPELYWAEVDGKRSSVKRCLFSRPWEVEVVNEQYARILGHPIVVQRRRGQNITAWLQETPHGVRAFTRKLEGGIWKEELDDKAELGAGAISYTGLWETGWDRLKREISRVEVEEKPPLCTETVLQEDELK